MSLVAGLDLGTTGVKALIIDRAGTVVGSSFQPYGLLHPRPSWAEQDADEWWQSTLTVLRDVVKLAAAKSSSIDAIGIGSQIDGLVCIDSSGKAVRNAIIWMDRRAVAECDWIKQRVPPAKLYDVTGNTVDPSHTAAKILWVRNHDQKSYSRSTRFLLPGNYIFYKLTGKFVTDYSNASCTMLFNIRKKQWSEALCSDLEIPLDRLPTPAPAESISGFVLPEVLKETGLRDRVAVVPGGGDEEVGVLGAGAVKNGDVLEITGTAEPVCVSLDQPVFDRQMTLELHAHVDPRKWILESTGIVAGGLYRWFREEFGQPEIMEAKKRGVDPYQLLDAEAENIPAGSEDLICLPFFMGSITPEWNPLARGVFYGLTLGHHRGHFIRAILEGCVFALRDVIEHAASMGLSPREIIAAGGGARGKVWRQIKADITKKPVAITKVEDVTAYGAALLAAIGLNWFSSVDEAAEKCIQYGERSIPNSANAEVYDRQYRLYRELYNALKPIFEKTARGE